MQGKPPKRFFILSLLCFCRAKSPCSLVRFPGFIHKGLSKKDCLNGTIGPKQARHFLRTVAAGPAGVARKPGVRLGALPESSQQRLSSPGWHQCGRLSAEGITSAAGGCSMLSAADCVYATDCISLPCAHPPAHPFMAPPTHTAAPTHHALQQRRLRLLPQVGQ